MQLSPTVKYSVAAFLISAAIGLLIASAVIDKTYWTFIVLIPIALVLGSLIKIAVTTKSGGADIIGYFLTGFFVISTAGTLLILRHTDAITDVNIVLGFLSVAAMIGAMVFGSYSFNSDGF